MALQWIPVVLEDKCEARKQRTLQQEASANIALHITPVFHIASVSIWLQAL